MVQNGTLGSPVNRKRIYKGSSYLPSKNDDPDGRIVPGVIECSDELLHSLRPEGIPHLGAVDRNLPPQKNE